MSNYTSNYNLLKPIKSEGFNVEHQNENMDIIDTELDSKISKETILLDKNEVIAVTEQGYLVDAKVINELYSELNNNLDIQSGTFTPTFEGLTTTGSPIYGSENNGTYYKIGNLVHILVDVKITAKGGTTGRLKIGNLPFSASSMPVYHQALGKIQLQGITYTTLDLEANFFVLSGANYILGTFQRSGNVSPLDTSSCADATRITLTGCYRIA